MHTSVVSSRSKVLYRPNILVVEDDLDNLFDLSSPLKMLNCNCLVANTAMSGLSIAQREQPDLILLDLGLPQISPIELLSILRSDWLTRKIPVIAITALTEAEEQEKIANAGFSHCLFKPYLLKDLERVIDAYINN